jgi:hypothetical protein
MCTSPWAVGWECAQKRIASEDTYALLALLTLNLLMPHYLGMTNARARRAQLNKLPYIVTPPLGSRHQISWHATEEEARSVAFDVAAASPDGRTEIGERTPSSYRDVGYVDYFGKFHRS